MMRYAQELSYYMFDGGINFDELCRWLITQTSKCTEIMTPYISTIYHSYDHVNIIN